MTTIIPKFPNSLHSRQLLAEITSKVRKPWIVIVAILFFCVVVPALFAQQESNLSIDDAIKIGLEKNSDIKISILKAKSVGDARVSEVEAGRFPSLKLFAGYTRLSDIGNSVIPVPIPNLPPFSLTTYFLDNYSVKLSLTQPIFTGFRLVNQQKQAEHTSNAAQQDIQSGQKSVIYAIQQEYWTLYKYQQTLTSVMEDSAEAESHLTDVKNDVAQGIALQNDLLKSQVQVSNIELQIIQTRNNIRIAMASLMNTIGLPLETQVTLASVPDSVLTQDRQLSSLIEQAQTKRAELKASDERIAAQQNSVSIAQSDYYPQVSVSGDAYYQNPNQRYFPAIQEFKTTWDASLNLSWDLWTWNTQGYQSQEAEYSVEQLQETKKQLEQTIALDVTQNYLTEQTSFSQIRVAKLSVEQATENLRVVKLQWSKGVATNSDVLDAQTLLMQAQVNYYSSVADANIVAARLKMSIGG